MTETTNDNDKALTMKGRINNVISTEPNLMTKVKNTNRVTYQ